MVSLRKNMPIEFLFFRRAVEGAGPYNSPIN